MLDRDLAELYGIETRALKQAVNRNQKRFPLDFMLVLTEKEIELMVSQNVIPSKKHLGGALPYVFTEQGVANLSSILNSEKAIKVNIQIMRVFTRFKELLSDNLNLYLEIEEIKKKISNQDQNIELVFSYLDELIEKGNRSIRRIGFKRSDE